MERGHEFAIVTPNGNLLPDVLVAINEWFGTNPRFPKRKVWCERSIKGQPCTYWNDRPVDALQGLAEGTHKMVFAGLDGFREVTWQLPEPPIKIVVEFPDLARTRWRLLKRQGEELGGTIDVGYLYEYPNISRFVVATILPDVTVNRWVSMTGVEESKVASGRLDCVVAPVKTGRSAKRNELEILGPVENVPEFESHLVCVTRRKEERAILSHLPPIPTRWACAPVK